MASNQCDYSCYRLPRVIKSIGGEELYGKHPEVALRELIQNASDAVHARRVSEQRKADYGSICVSLTNPSDNSYWLEVRDDGIGMSKHVLTNFLLDFGRPFWGSAEMQREFPGLLSSGMKQIGKYGIGFFSVFMLAEHVQIITRRSDAAAKDTLVLEFSRGLKGRPILREADSTEQMIDGGTRIRLKLLMEPSSEGGLLYQPYRKNHRTLTEMCIGLCPSLEVDLIVEENGASQQVVTGGDWRTLDSHEFVKRIPPSDSDHRVLSEDVDEFRIKSAENLRFLYDTKGEIVGRAFITVGYGNHFSQPADLSGVVIIGGLTSCSLSGIAGVLMGVPTRASRDAAKPIVDDSELKRWAEEQSTLVPALWEDSKNQAACAKYIRLCGGDTGELPICRNNGRWCSATEIRLRADLPENVVLLDDFTFDFRLEEYLESYTLNDNVFVVPISGIPGLLQCNVAWPQDIHTNYVGGSTGFINRTLGGAVVEAIAQVWGVDIESLLKVSSLERESDVTIGFTDKGDLIERAIVLTKPDT